MHQTDEKRSETHYHLLMVRDCGAWPGTSYFLRDLVYTTKDGLTRLTRKGEILLRILEGDYYDGIKEKACSSGAEGVDSNPEASA